MQSFQNFFSRHAKEYASSENRIKAKDLDLLVAMLNPKNTEKALDLGTGPGFVAFRMAEKVSISVGLDFTENMLDIAARKALSVSNTVFVKGDATSIPFPDETFDIVTCRRAAHHIKNKEKLIKEVRRVLKKDGKFGLTDNLKPIGDKLGIMNKMEIARDSTYMGAISLNQWFKLFKENAFRVDDFTTFDIRETFDSWLSPVSKNSPGGKKARVILNNNLNYFKEIFGYKKDLDSFNKTRFIIVARK